jgi:hypothetical protein
MTDLSGFFFLLLLLLFFSGTDAYIIRFWATCLNCPMLG